MQFLILVNSEPFTHTQIYGIGVGRTVRCRPTYQLHKNLIIGRRRLGYQLCKNLNVG